MPFPDGQFRCLDCGHEWSVKPVIGTTWSNQTCPRCTRYGETGNTDHPIAVSGFNVKWLNYEDMFGARP